MKGDKDHIRIALGQISDIKDIKIEDAKEEHAWNVMLSTKEDMDIREEVFFKQAHESYRNRSVSGSTILLISVTYHFYILLQQKN